MIILLLLGQACPGAAQDENAQKGEDLLNQLDEETMNSILDELVGKLSQDTSAPAAPKSTRNEGATPATVAESAPAGNAGFDSATRPSAEAPVYDTPESVNAQPESKVSGASAGFENIPNTPRVDVQDAPQALPEEHVSRHSEQPAKSDITEADVSGETTELPAAALAPSAATPSMQSSESEPASAGWSQENFTPAPISETGASEKSEAAFVTNATGDDDKFPDIAAAAAKKPKRVKAAQNEQASQAVDGFQPAETSAPEMEPVPEFLNASRPKKSSKVVSEPVNQPVTEESRPKENLAEESRSEESVAEESRPEESVAEESRPEENSAGESNPTADSVSEVQPREIPGVRPRSKNAQAPKVVKHSEIGFTDYYTAPERYLTQEKVDSESVKIMYPKYAHQLLTVGDTVFFQTPTSPTLSPDERYYIYKSISVPRQEIGNPPSSVYGRIGKVKISEINQKVTSAVIIAAGDIIHTGDIIYLRPVQ